jgi:protocatechuate 3,4-dioxygenase beta subunit
LEYHIQSTKSDVSELIYLIQSQNSMWEIIPSEDRQGIPLTLHINLIEVATCQPIPKAAVDIWHCDAQGIYSHFINGSLGGTGGPPQGPPPAMNGTRPARSPGGPNQNTDNSTFLRDE